MSLTKPQSGPLPGTPLSRPSVEAAEVRGSDASGSRG